MLLSSGKSPEISRGTKLTAVLVKLTAGSDTPSKPLPGISFTTWMSDRLIRKLLPKLLALATMLPVLMLAILL